MELGGKILGGVEYSVSAEFLVIFFLICVFFVISVATESFLYL